MLPNHMVRVTFWDSNQVSVTCRTHPGFLLPSTSPAMSYETLHKAILTKEQLQYFQESQTQQEIVSYIETLNVSVVGVKLTDDCSSSNVSTNQTFSETTQHIYH